MSDPPRPAVPLPGGRGALTGKETFSLHNRQPGPHNVGWSPRPSGLRRGPSRRRGGDRGCPQRAPGGGGGRGGQVLVQARHSIERVRKGAGRLIAVRGERTVSDPREGCPVGDVDGAACGPQHFGEVTRLKPAPGQAEGGHTVSGLGVAVQHSAEVEGVVQDQQLADVPEDDHLLQCGPRDVPGGVCCVREAAERLEAGSGAAASDEGVEDEQHPRLADVLAVVLQA
mmetsp:Transcript_52621/g.93906  ORF Transcript_52621/g.93906 Transcript_52621/m.93906 type:complete len:227 (+) Transcript_52621:118-798(+)